MNNEYVSAKEIAILLPYAVRTIEDKISRRKDFPAPYRPSGWQRFWKRAEVIAWIESKKCNTN